MADEDKGWYKDLVGETAYDKLLDLRWKYLMLLRCAERARGGGMERLRPSWQWCVIIAEGMGGVGSASGSGIDSAT